MDIKIDNVKIRYVSAPAPYVFIIVAVVMMCCAEPGKYDATSAASTACPGATTKGVDVSDLQPGIDWRRAHANGIGFGYAKATQGTYNTQASFAQNWQGMAAAGVVRGAYHFFDPTEDGVAQARYFLSVVGSLGAGDLPAMLDVECPNGDPRCLGFAGGTGDAPAATIRTRILDFLSTVTAQTGKLPLIYTYLSFFDSGAIDTSGFESYPLFLGNATGGTGCSEIQSPWTTLAVWQYDWNGVVPGIPGTVDLDWFLGAPTALQGFARAGVPRIGAISNGHFYVKEGGLNAQWVDEYANVSAGALSSNRIGVLTKSGHFLVKEGSLGSEWTDEYAGAIAGTIAGDRIGVVAADGHFYVKEGGLSAHWVDELADVNAGFLSGNRIGVLAKNGHFFVKEGSLDAQWVDQYANVKAGALSGNRIGILGANGHFYVKQGGLNALWIDEYANVSNGVLSGDRIGVLTGDGQFLVKQGALSGQWVNEYSHVIAGALSADRIGVLANGHFYVKEGGLGTHWIDEHASALSGVLPSD